MQYLLLCCIDGNTWDALPQSQRDTVMQQYGEWVQDVGRTGQYLAGAKLQPTTNATTIRSRNGKLAVVDGPFAETKEQLAGFYLIDARDLNDAIQIASKIPPAREGSIEVRPVRELSL